jgi:hypothetical protein
MYSSRQSSTSAPTILLFIRSFISQIQLRVIESHNKSPFPRPQEKMTPILAPARTNYKPAIISFAYLWGLQRICDHELSVRPHAKVRKTRWLEARVGKRERERERERERVRERETR